VNTNKRSIEMATTRKRKGVKAQDAVVIPNPSDSSALAEMSTNSFNLEEGGSPQADAKISTSELSIQEKVALLAYSYWQERGCQGGSPEEDWFRAEREVLDQLSVSKQ
jgi:hypothetical protein